MVFPILGANSATGGYEVSKSLRFDNDDSTFLSLTQTAGNRRTLTFSTWLKRSTLGDQNIFNGGNSSSEFTAIYFTSADELFLYDYRGAEGMSIKTNRKFRDVSAWYHIVVAFDTTQSTASNRVKFYVNGVQETSFSISNYPAQNLDLMLNVNSSFTTRIGRYPTSSTLYFDGYMCETAVVEDSQLDPTSFGEFDDNNVWIPKDLSSLTFGDEGFYLKYEDTSDAGADSSGNGNNFTGSGMGAIDHVEDTCTNNFATLNVLKTTSTNANLQDGACRFNVTANGTSQNRNTFATITFPDSGKWYMETKVTHSSLTSDSGNQVYIGVVENPQNVDHRSTSNVNSISTNGIFTDVRLVGTISDAIQHGTNGSATSYNTDPDWSSGDIIGIALDMDNGRIYYHLNGTYYDDASGNVPNPATPANHNHSFTVPSNGLTFFMSILRYNTGTVNMQTNFGNPTYSVSSGNNDGKYGNFEYAPPSGYYALCTKRLAEFG